MNTDPHVRDGDLTNTFHDECQLEHMLLLHPFMDIHGV